ncbi:DgyrCDS13714 [Dimorphilus gyrociliatus]|uniref:DgyrCDS13714 n=1 Tax=Dimorphilus gyrociliatus TaxID=2664684 RepID=A0A7I8WBI3_9ANNE|nr:DgyrCDS13714 [Dimorphilus gyrociliatus]
MELNEFVENSTVLEENSKDVIYLDEISAAKLLYKESSKALLTIVMPFILGLGLVTNLSFIFVFVRIPRIRNVTTMYLINLACSDMTYLSFVIGDKILRYSSSPFSADYSAWGEYGCKLITGVIFIPHYISEFTITLFTVERYITICQPLKRAYFCSRTRTLIFIACVWLLSFALSIPCLYFIEGRMFNIIWTSSNTDYERPSKYLKCGVRPVKFTGGLTLQCYALQTIPFFFTFIVTGILNIIMIRELNESAKTSISLGADKKAKSVTERKDIIKMLVVTSLIFYSFVLPYFIDDLINAVTYLGDWKTIKLPTDFLQLARFLAYTNSAINPIIYGAVSSRYRQAFMEAFCPFLSSNSTSTIDNRVNTVHDNDTADNTYM